MYRTIINTRISATSYENATSRIIDWAGVRDSRYVCAANVHMVMEAYDSASFQEILDEADLVTPDGMPLVWGMRLQGIKKQTRVCGPNLMLSICNEAAISGIPVGLFGGSTDVVSLLQAKLLFKFPNLKIVYSCSPPFRELTHSEDQQIIKDINGSGASILFIGLGCPKQERWMAEHKHHIHAVMIGVGAAFNFHAGRIKQAPSIVQLFGLEWFYRLCIEPRRLWRRYLKHNPRFLVLFMVQLFRSRIFKPL